VVEGCSNPSSVGAVAGSGKLTEAGLDAPEPISVQLFGLFWNQRILASCQLIETLDVHATTEGTSDFGHGEAGVLPLVTRPHERRCSNDCRCRNVRRPNGRVG